MSSTNIGYISHKINSAVPPNTGHSIVMGFSRTFDGASVQFYLHPHSVAHSPGASDRPNFSHLATEVERDTPGGRDTRERSRGNSRGARSALQEDGTGKRGQELGGDRLVDLDQ